MSDTFTTSQSWISRLGGSIKGIFVGLLMIIGAIVLLWWNEGRAVKTAKGLEQGQEEVIQSEGTILHPENENKLIYVSGLVETNDTLSDPAFNVKENVLRLKRSVEMYQWSEYSESKKKKKIGGGEETTVQFKYKQVWSSSLINSGQFKLPEGHINPQSIPFAEYDRFADKIQLGSFTIPSNLKNGLSSFNPTKINSIDTSQIKNATIIDDGVNSHAYIGDGSIGQPLIGDVKISFAAVSNGDYSIVAKQVKNTFEPFKTNTNTTINMIRPGVVSSDSMFEAAVKSNTVLTWVFRVLGFFLIFSAVSMILKPLVIVGDLIPFVGNIINMGTSIVAGLVAVCLAGIVIALAWIFYRPILGFSILAISVAAGYYLFTKAKKNKTQTAQ